ncbi:MAG: hypothetical protein NTV02_01485 [Candidatus Zambryskibacteria bacterium]|nr:hypothetical protein [Candidatus Zambryskibacteria bacterium]
MISRLLYIFYTINLCLVIGAFTFTTLVFAQFNSSSDVSVGILPQNPEPYQEVYVTMESYSIDLNSSNIRWYVNNKLVSQGVGVKKITTRVGKLGSETVVRIEVSSGVDAFTKTVSIRPTSLDILWEARTYTPPFYKGKALFTHQSNIIFVALPHIVSNGKEIPKENLTYTWTKNGTILGEQSGYGKYTLPLVGSIISRPITIDVLAEDPKTGLSSFNTLSLEPQEPSILFYKNDPLYGIQYQKAFQSTVPLSSKEIVIQAIPYFFSTPNAFSSDILSFSWSINGNKIVDGDNSLTKTFRRVGDVVGISNISLSIEQTERILQFSTKSLVIDFKKESASTETF